MNKFLASLKIEEAIILTDQAHKEFDQLDRNKIIAELPDDAFIYLSNKTPEMFESALLVGWLEARVYHKKMKPKQSRLF